VWGVPRSSHARFVADLWAHRAAYLAGYFGTVVLWSWIVRQRQRLAAEGGQSGYNVSDVLSGADANQVAADKGTR